MKSERDRNKALAPEKERIEQFWNWFSVAHSALENLLLRSEAVALANEVDSRLAVVTQQLGWEMGPGLSKTYSLAFSLNGDQSAIPIAKALIYAAPKFEAWEFYVGKPPKKWDGRLIIRNPKGQTLQFETLQWKYVLYGFESNSYFDILLVAPSLPKMDHEALTQVAFIAIESYLGEYLALERVNNVELVSEDAITLNDSASASEITHLRDHMILLTKEQDELGSSVVGE
jgi:hypothetical protein